MTDAVNEYPTTETKSMSPWSMLVNVLFSPTRVFQAAREKPKWAVPAIVIIVLLALNAILIAPMTNQIGIDMIQKSDRLTDAQKTEIIQGMKEQGPIAMAKSAVGSAIFLFIVWLIGAGLSTLFGNVMFSAGLRFVHYFVIMVLSFSPWVIGAIVKTPLMMAKNDVDIRTSLAVLSSSPIVGNVGLTLLNTFTDIFILWTICLIVLGIKTMSGLSLSKSITVVAPTVILFILVVFGSTALMKMVM